MSYDHMGRRREKNAQRFFYDDYLQICSYHSLTPNSNCYIWDPTENVATRPLVRQTNNCDYFYAHDGNKNVSEVVDSDVGIAAHYEYAPFGAVIAQYGELAESNPWRFSSEFDDFELGVNYYNYRHYEPLIGRCLARDFLQEEGGESLYEILRNRLVSCFDVLGLAPSYVFDLKNCKLKVAISWVLVFVDNPKGKWTSAEKRNWMNAAKSSVKNYFDGLTFKCYPQGDRCCKCKNGVSIGVELKYVSAGDFKVTVFHDPKHQSKKKRDRSSLELDIGDVEFQNKIKNYAQKPLIHEVGHLLGLSHPGGDNNSDDAYMRDPESLMGAGMVMRKEDFEKAFCAKINAQDSYCTGWEAK
ncbi:MAG: hypothetical protein IKJ45_08880 [Kiritimatiellae bacterium]|nr:hypothetical protein [Kiritimatiellia bacterium]